METAPKAFEPNAAAQGRPGYWGPITSSIDWCERNYVVSYFVAEWWNTLSNAPLLLLGLWGVLQCLRYGHEARFIAVYAGIAVIGVGSVAFHASLTHVAQQGDETPMMVTILSWYYCLLWMHPEAEDAHPVARKLTAVAFFAFSAVWTVVHYHFAFVLVFQWLFAAITFLALVQLVRETRRVNDPEGRALGVTYVCTLLVATALWLCDCHFCEALHDLPWGLPNPQLHGWWHALIGVNCYVGPSFLVFRRASLLGRRPRVRWVGALLPYVHVPSPRHTE